MTRRGFLTTTCATCALFLFSGCDPVRTTIQSVRLQVVDANTDKPVVGVLVSLRTDYVTLRPLSNEINMTADEWDRYKREIWDRQPWFSAVTDAHGYANIDIRYTALDRTNGPTPPSSRDFVTGKPYVVRVGRDGPVEEQLAMPMMPGESARGKSYVVTVNAVCQPNYVNTR